MKMPETIDSKLLAPCGSLKCKIKTCFDKKNFSYCGRCSEFPCPLIKKHSKKYVKRHDLNTLESAKRIKTMGIGHMMSEDKEKWTCPECEGIIKFQTKTCSECGFEETQWRTTEYKFCPNCGCQMKEVDDESI